MNTAPGNPYQCCEVCLTNVYPPDANPIMINGVHGGCIGKRWPKTAAVLTAELKLQDYERIGPDFIQVTPHMRIAKV